MRLTAFLIKSYRSINLYCISFNPSVFMFKTTTSLSSVSASPTKDAKQTCKASTKRTAPPGLTNFLNLNKYEEQYIEILLEVPEYE